MSTEILIVAEGADDSRVCRHLIDRALRHHVGWLADHEDLEPFRTWRGDASSSHLSWRRLRDVARDIGVPLRRGHFDGNPAQPDADQASIAIRLATTLKVNAVVLCRDADNQPERRAGISQARAQRGAMTVVVALADPRTETWRLLLWEPRTDEDRQRLEDVRREARMDPITAPRSFTDRRAGEPRNPKEAVARLQIDDDVLDRHPIDEIVRRDAKIASGLAEFLSDVRTELVPLIGAPQR